MHVAVLFKAHINTIHTDFSAWRNLFAEDAILEMPFGASAGIDTTLSGVDAIAESVGGFVGALRDPHITIKNVYQIEGEDSVVAEFAMTASVIPTGKHYSRDYVCYLRAANEKIAFYREACRAAGTTHGAVSPALRRLGCRDRR
jgi:uncharacterized protein